jgi:hypothetical protein
VGALALCYRWLICAFHGFCLWYLIRRTRHYNRKRSKCQVNP